MESTLRVYKLILCLQCMTRRYSVVVMALGCHRGDLGTIQGESRSLPGGFGFGSGFVAEEQIASNEQN